MRTTAGMFEGMGPWQPPALADGEIHLWIADRWDLSPLPADLGAVLSADEELRAARFHFRADRDRFRIGRALLRIGILGYTQVAPETLRFRSTAYGKLEIDSPQCGVQVNLSHSGDLILLAFTLDRAIGVDVEQMRDTVDLESLAQSCFTAAELDAIFRNGTDARVRFFEYWVAKESFIKADGRGMSLPLRDYTLSPGPSTGTYTVSLANGSGALDWSTRLLPCRTDYPCAVTTRPGWHTLRTFAVAARSEDDGRSSSAALRQTLRVENLGESAPHGRVISAPGQ